MKKHRNNFRWLVLIGIIACFMWSGAARAQQSQTITGIGTIGGDSKMPLTITFAPTGGQVSGNSIYHGPMVSFSGEAGCNGSQTITMSGTFAGGDGGAASGTLTNVMIIEGEPCKASTLTFTGKWSGNFHATGSGNGTMQMDFGDFGTDSAIWQVTYSPEEFQGALSTPTPTGAACTPTVRGLSPQKPGDVIAPGATYHDETGNEVGDVQEYWYFNGVETTSIVWDGKKVTVELQWSCPNNFGDYRIYTIPAYQDIPVPDTSQPSLPSGLPGAVGIAIGIGSIIIGIAGVTGVAGIAIGQVIKGLPVTPPVQPPPAPTPPIEGALPIQPPPAPTPPIEGAPPIQPPPAPTPPIEGAPPVQPPPAPTPPSEGAPPIQPPPAPTPPSEGAPPIQPPPATTPPSEGAPPVQSPPAPTPPSEGAPTVQPPPATPEPGEQPQPPKRNLTPEEKTDLINRRGQMQEEVDNLRDKIKQTHDAVSKLSRLKKNNMIKFIFKKAIDVANWIMGSKVEVINKITVDPAMDTLLGKHDTSHDGEIIVNVNNRIQSLKAEIDDFRKQVGYLLEEIKKTNQSLAGGG